MFYQQVFSCFPNFLRQLISRKSYNALEREIHTNNVLNSYVTPIQMIALGVGGIIGE
jgi:hypothetical protein